MRQGGLIKESTHPLFVHGGIQLYQEFVHRVQPLCYLRFQHAQTALISNQFPTLPHILTFWVSRRRETNTNWTRKTYGCDFSRPSEYVIRMRGREKDRFVTLYRMLVRDS